MVGTPVVVVFSRMPFESEPSANSLERLLLAVLVMNGSPERSALLPVVETVQSLDTPSVSKQVKLIPVPAMKLRTDSPETGLLLIWISLQVALPALSSAEIVPVGQL